MLMAPDIQELVLRHLRHDQRTHGRKKNAAGGQVVARKETPSKGKAFTSLAEGREFLTKHYGAWKENLTPKEEKAMAFYQSPGYALMNGQLRGDKVNAPAADLKRARDATVALKGAIEKAPPLKEPMTVYRGFSADQFGKLRPGQEITDKGFVSTSIFNDATSVANIKNAAKATVTLPKGTKAAAGSVRELVLPPDTKFKVIAVNGRKVELEVIL